MNISTLNDTSEGTECNPTQETVKTCEGGERTVKISGEETVKAGEGEEETLKIGVEEAVKTGNDGTEEETVTMGEKSIENKQRRN